MLTSQAGNGPDITATAAAALMWWIFAWWLVINQKITTSVQIQLGLASKQPKGTVANMLYMRHLLIA